MEWLKLTRDDGTKFLCNMDKVEAIVPSEARDCTMLYFGSDDQMFIIESIDQMHALIQGSRRFEELAKMVGLLGDNRFADVKQAEEALITVGNRIMEKMEEGS